MERRPVLEHLAEADRHVALSDRHISRQVEIIDELLRAGHPTSLAQDVLTTYRALRATHIAHRDMIRDELRQA